ncbi:MAG: membrane protein insertase YidC [Calditrichaeota bacterium]|nr:MAG: membrane protein insertase YidC [Calditrichota bacterium]
MDKDKSTIIGLILIGFIILLTYSDFYKEFVLGDNYQTTETTTEQAGQMPDEKPIVQKQSPNVQKESVSNIQQSIPVVENPTITSALNSSEEKTITIENDLVVVKISTIGPSVTYFELKNYLSQNEESAGNVNLIHGQTGNVTLNIPLKEDTLHLANKNFTFMGLNENNYFDKKQGPLELPFRYFLDEGKYIDQIFVFSKSDYSFKVKVKFVNLTDYIDGYKYGMKWTGGIASPEKILYEDMQYTTVWALTADDEIERDISDDETLNEFNDDWTIRWGAVRNKYFTAAIIPESRKGTGIKLQGNSIPTSSETFFKTYSYEIMMPVMSGNHSDEFLVYIGPLEYSLLTSYKVDLDRMMNFGWQVIRPISKGVLWTLKKLHTVIPNYGFVIILFSILIKVVLYPLTKKSYQSMKEMQVIQPEVTALREKHKDNPQKMNSEMMALYKEHGVNPLGGCMPMLFQMPVLYALFIIFRTTIELRGAYFIGWITDLSAPDTVYTLPFTLPMYGNGINVLPILMGVTMFFQQKATIKDPKQKAMVYFMPFLFTFMFNSFPSGLTLYYTLFNLFSMLQQKFAPATAKKTVDKKDGKKGKKPKSRLDFYRQQAELKKKK